MRSIQIIAKMRLMPSLKRRRTSAWLATLAPKGRRQPANSDHVYKGGDQCDAGGEHKDFVKFEARNQTHAAHGYPQSSTRHRKHLAPGTEAKMWIWNLDARLLCAKRMKLHVP